MMHSIRSTMSRIWVLAALIASALGAAVTVIPASAAGDHIVNTTVDETTPGDGLCSLREAMLNSKNKDNTYSECGLGTGTDSIFFTSSSTITLGSALPTVSTTLTINGSPIIQASDCDPVNVPGGCTPATYGIMATTTGGDLELDGLQLQNGSATSGGALYIASGTTVTLISVTFQHNLAQSQGGAIDNFGSLHVSQSTFLNNKSMGGGGAIWSPGGSTFAIYDSDFESNIAIGSSGAVFNNGFTPTPKIVNSTFYNNSANYGGAIENDDTLILVNDTFSGSYASGLTHGGAIWNAGDLTLKNTILANSLGGAEDCYNAGGDTITANLNSLIETNGASGHMCGTPAFNTDPGMLNYGNFGGLTKTLALSAGSPAIDNGDDTTCAAAPVSGLDQRGISRTRGLHCDIGAFEFIPPGASWDTDLKTDPAVFEKTSGNWFDVGSTSGFGVPALNFGDNTNYVQVPGDYDGDHKIDAAVFEKATGNWFVVGSNIGFFTPALNFGASSNFVPVPADYDGDGKIDPAVYDTTTGNWFAVGSTRGFFTPALSFGGSGFTPVPADYDGDGQADPAVFQTSTGNWFVVGSTRGFFTPALNFGGGSNYAPVPGDFDGDGKTDPAVFEKSAGNWFAVGSSRGFMAPALGFGNSASFITVSGDYDGDGKIDPAVYEIATGNWFVVGSTAGFFTPALGFGNTSFKPVVPAPR